MMTDEPLDLTDIEARDANYTAGAQLLRDRRALLAEVKRLRAQLEDVWDDGHEAGIDFAYGTYTDNPYRTQPEETP